MTAPQPPQQATPADQERALAATLTDLRARRRKAEQDIAQAGVLRLAIERTARDHSSGTTEEIETVRDAAQALFDEVLDLAEKVDQRRTFIPRLRALYPTVPVPERLLVALSEEAAWREQVNADPRAAAFRVHLPAALDIS